MQNILSQVYIRSAKTFSESVSEYHGFFPPIRKYDTVLMNILTTNNKTRFRGTWLKRNYKIGMAVFLQKEMLQLILHDVHIEQMCFLKPFHGSMVVQPSKMDIAIYQITRSIFGEKQLKGKYEKHISKD